MAGPGAAAPEVEQTYTRARALCAQIGDTPGLFPTLLGLAYFYADQGALLTARELAEQLFELAQRLAAHAVLGFISFWQGDYVAAWTHCEQGSACIDPTALPVQALYHIAVSGGLCRVIAAHTRWCLGYPAHALRLVQEALAQAQVLAHPYSLTFAQHYAAYLHHRRRDAPATQAQAEALLTLAKVHEFPLFTAFGTCLRAWPCSARARRPCWRRERC